jgi:hypothetical protein
MIGWLLLSLVMVAIELWWVVAFAYAYRQLRDRRLLLQVAHGVLLLLFFALIFVTNGLNQQIGLGVIQYAVLLLALAATLGWQFVGGPRLLRERYARPMRDVLRLRRPAVDMRRRVRGR